MTRIATAYYRYKRPPGKRKPVAFEVPAVVTAKKQPPPSWGGAAAGMQVAPVSERKGAVQPSTPREAARVAPAANADRKPAILTIRKPGKRFASVPDLTKEEHRRRGDAADAMWRELVRRATGNEQEP